MLVWPVRITMLDGMPSVGMDTEGAARAAIHSRASGTALGAAAARCCIMPTCRAGRESVATRSTRSGDSVQAAVAASTATTRGTRMERSKGGGPGETRGKPGLAQGRNPRLKASVRSRVTAPRLQSSALREWDRLVGALETARRDPRRLGPWAVQVVRFAAKVVFVAVLPFLVAYSIYALVYLSSANAKSDRVRAYYASLHPLLRVGLSTLIVFDGDAVITDLARRPEDYKTMGLPPNDGSLHLVQRDGYAHAADLRTGGRGFLRNRLVQLYLWGLGFSTLRHTGTSDHLHVELPVQMIR